MNDLVKTLTIILMLMLLACSLEQPEYPALTPPENFASPQNIKIGAELFKQKCASCHGHPSEGRSLRADFFQPPAPDFSATFYKEVDPAYLFWRIRTGKTIEPWQSQGSVMPAWNDHLGDAQVWQLVAYLRSRSR
ncbi:MAG: cytochrome c [Desulfuromonadales bacterium]|nr:cytochrome c [Desulfuromonadales bacterium]MDT8423523.1 cytochrome c [Desulfuromonadales bacterium]